MIVEREKICVFTLYDGTEIKVALVDLLKYAGAIGSFKLPGENWVEVGPTKTADEISKNWGLKKRRGLIKPGQ